ncbi:MAG: hypothetical protein ACREYF_07360, partial [Gammaproteobacteria bacterium]
ERGHSSEGYPMTTKTFASHSDIAEIIRARRAEADGLILQDVVGLIERCSAAAAAEEAQRTTARIALYLEDRDAPHLAADVLAGLPGRS